MYAERRVDLSSVGFMGIFVSPSDSWRDRICDVGGIPVMVSSFCFSAWRLTLLRIRVYLLLTTLGLLFFLRRFGLISPTQIRLPSLSHDIALCCTVCQGGLKTGSPATKGNPPQIPGFQNIGVCG